MQQTLRHAGAISLRECLPTARFVGADDVHVTSCSADPRRCQPGDLYVALLGPDGDGHDQVHEAINRGAVAVLAERLLPVSVPLCMVDDTRQAYGQLCHQLLGDPARGLCVVGVTGSSGKTCVTILLRAVLHAAGQPTGMISTLGHFDGARFICTGDEVPPPVLARSLADMAANGCTHAVVEFSSRALAQRWAAGLSLDAAVLTNLRRDHLDFHGSVLNYRRAKWRLLDQLERDGLLVINDDDRASRGLLSAIDYPTLTIGLNTPAQLTATVIERYPSEQTFLISAGSQSCPVRTRIVGDAHVYNCLCAAAVGLASGMDLTTIARGLESVQSLPGRMERVECGQPFGVFIDVAGTPDRLSAALRTVRQVTRRRLICVLASRQDVEPAVRPLLGRVAERGADTTILSSDESGLATVHDTLDGFERPGQAHILPDRARAVCWALAQARPGDAVLLAGGHRGDLAQRASAPVDDRQIAQRWLYQIGAKIDYSMPEDNVRCGWRSVG